MMEKRISRSAVWCSNLLALLLCFGPAASLLAGQPPNWDKAAALQAAMIEDGQKQVQQWLQQVDAGQALQVLDALQQAPASGTPAIEAQLHALAQAMAEAPLDDGSNRLLDWLENYRSQVLVPHEESASHGVALFPVAAAASGSRVHRQRHAARLQGGSLLADPQRWVATYLDASAFERQGLEQGLRETRAAALAPLAGLLPAELAAHPALAAPAGIVASSRLDVELLLAAYQYSPGASAARLIREAGWRLDAAQRNRLFNGILALPDTHKAALGISLLAPGLHGNPMVSQRLLELLDHPQLGAAAALALAGHPDSAVQASLQRKMDSSGLAAQRAALALGMPAADLLHQPPDEGNQ